jgi:hypothetical protein
MEPLRGSENVLGDELLLLMEPLRGSKSIPSILLNYLNIGEPAPTCRGVQSIVELNRGAVLLIIEK